MPCTPSIATTIQAEHAIMHAERSSWEPVLAMAAITVGTALFLLAIPAVMSDLLSMPGNPIMRQLQNEQKVSRSDLRSLIHSRKMSAKWREMPTTYTDISLGYLILENYLSHEDYPGNLQQAEGALGNGLALAPMNPYGWMRLVQIRKIRGAPVAQVAEPFRLALKSGHNEDKRHMMLLLIVETGLDVWDELDEQEREIIAQKAQRAWDRDPRRTATLAVRTGRSDLLAELLGL